ncbi:hypothetical protein [Microbulbifer sp. ARAS458-1]|uniref:hypothetical protein n=1 Tax=Microbulbifer sp. ARAS458-1 TaxID=3140242 RepID=UPI003877FBB5
MSSLVVTSINPHAKIERQRLCFDRWKLLGYEILTFNSEGEASLLLDSGFAQENVVIIDEEETASPLFDKRIPRIMPVLRRAIDLNFSNYFLVNSDIYASHRKPVSSLLSSFGESVALTRNECVNLAYHKYSDSSPYRGGLDVFYFTKSGLRETFDKLSSSPVSERMTFGVPGWDYFLGHTILMRGGLIMDGEVFLHQSHQTSYGAIDEFKYYSEQMLSSGLYREKEVASLAGEFAQKITTECERNFISSRLLKRMYYQGSLVTDLNVADDRLTSVIHSLTEILGSHGVSFSPTDAFRGFLCGQLQGVNWAAASAFRENEMRTLPVIQGGFILLLSLVLINRELGRLRISTRYPDGSLHGVELQQIMTNTAGTDRLRHLLDLFASELIEHSIFNKELFKYFVLSSLSARTFNTCSALLSTVRKSY